MPLDNIRMPSSLKVEKPVAEGPIKIQDSRVILLGGALIKSSGTVYKTQEDLMIYLADATVKQEG